jgi:hypothetical protein
MSATAIVHLYSPGRVVVVVSVVAVGVVAVVAGCVTVFAGWVTVVVGVLMLMFVVEFVVAGFFAAVDPVSAELLLPPPDTANAIATPAITTNTASTASQAFEEPDRRRAPHVGQESAFEATGPPQLGQNPDPERDGEPDC